MGVLRRLLGYLRGLECTGAHSGSNGVREHRASYCFYWATRNFCWDSAECPDMWLRQVCRQCTIRVRVIPGLSIPCNIMQSSVMHCDACAYVYMHVGGRVHMSLCACVYSCIYVCMCACCTHVCVHRARVYAERCMRGWMDGWESCADGFMDGWVGG